MIEDSFISRLYLFFNFVNLDVCYVFGNISNMSASILVLTLFLTLIFSSSYSNYVVGEDIFFSCSIIFEGKVLVVSLITLVSSKRHVLDPWCLKPQGGLLYDGKTASTISQLGVVLTTPGGGYARGGYGNNRYLHRLPSEKKSLYIAAHPILDLCLVEEWRPGEWFPKR